MRVGIQGAFGGGNCGDEAMMHVHHKIFEKDADVFLVTNAYKKETEREKYWPYSDRPALISTDKSIPASKSLDAYIIGGGNVFALGFNQLFFSARKGVKVFLSGVGLDGGYYHPVNIGYNEAVKSTLSLCEHIYVRDKKSLDVAKRLGLPDNYKYSPDWAHLLKQDEEYSLSLKSGYACLVIRNSGKKTPDYYRLSVFANKLKSFCKAEGLELVLLPFSKGDEKICVDISRENDITLPEGFVDIFWEPEKVQSIISKSELVVSNGRFHPIVFSATAATPFVYVDFKHSTPPDDKNLRFCEDNQFLDFYGVGESDHEIINRCKGALYTSRNDLLEKSEVLTSLARKSANELFSSICS
ncbi:MAG: polysaccharide pyruvyl transferase family protein [Pseudomonadota bacterium]